MKKLIITLITMFIIVITPFIIFQIISSNISPKYNLTYTSALKDKYQRLIETNEKKIIFVGGSSLPFGLDSSLIEENTGYKVVNLGLYATLGTKMMMEISLANINSDDIIILAPELDEQTYSLYFNATATLEATEEMDSIHQLLSFSEREKLFYSSFRFNINRLTMAEVIPDGVYQRSSFNEYGDISYSRAGNKLINLYDSSQMINVNDNLLDNEFLSYVNSYTKTVNKKGAKVYFTFSPLNSMASTISDDFQKNLEDSLDCEVIGNINDFIYDPLYFYDTNFHLNDCGKIVHTASIINLIRNKLSLPSINFTLPNPPSAILEGEEIEGNNDHVSYFNYEEFEAYYLITSVKEEYHDIDFIIIPSSYNNKPVYGINSLAFSSMSNLVSISIPKSVIMLSPNMFLDCEKLVNIYIYNQSPSSISVPLSNFLDGCPNNVKIYVPANCKSKYTSDYTWRRYQSYILEME